MFWNKKIIFTTVGISLFLSMGITFCRYYILRDYIIYAEVACDPNKEKCFVRHCTEDDLDPCDFLHVKYTRYYKIVRKIASHIPLCNQNIEQCPPLTCQPSEENCEIITCTEGYNDDNCSNVRTTTSPKGAQ